MARQRGGGGGKGAKRSRGGGRGGGRRRGGGGRKRGEGKERTKGEKRRGGRGRTKSSVSSFSSSSLHCTSSALSEKDPFTNIKRRDLIKVPLSFTSLHTYCEILANNILAEFYHVYRDGKTRGRTLRLQPLGDGRCIANSGGSGDDGLAQHLLGMYCV